MRGKQASARRAGRASALGLGMLLAAALPAGAQTYSSSASYNAGAIFFGKWNKASSAGTIALSPAAGWVVGLQAEKWLGSGQLGLRFEGAYTHRPLELPEGRDRNLAIGLGDAGLVLRLLPVAATPTVTPYLSAAAGFIYYGLGAGSELLFPTANARYEGGNHLEPAAVGAFGFDIPTSLRWDGDPVGIRLEGSDVVARSPLRPISGASFGPVHNFRVVLGVYAGVGSLR